VEAFLGVLAAEVGGAARFSRDGRYRLSLVRAWDEGPRVAWIMLNPSTAGADQDDPTLRRCIDFARRWGCGSLEVVNLFALVTPLPGALRTASAPIGPDNDAAIAAAIARADLVVAAWGAAHRGLLGRADDVRARLPARAMCLGFTKSGDPRHPLYLARDTPLVPLPH
jgi:hypothetical protein